MTRLCIFTCADGKYEDFTPLFIASCLWSNPQAIVEVGLEDMRRFAEEHRESMSRLASIYGRDSFLLRDTIWRTPAKRRIVPGSVRFLTEPLSRAEYVYISDIDIVTLESSIEEKHIAHMARSGLPYSNWVRTGKKRLTGLHFSRQDWQYPLPAHADLNVSSVKDEELLYELVKRKLEFDPPEDGEKYRPVHGIHMSPNRSPVGMRRNDRWMPGWLVAPHREPWTRLRTSENFRDMEPHFSERIRSFIQQVDQRIKDLPDPQERKKLRAGNPAA